MTTLFRCRPRPYPPHQPRHVLFKYWFFFSFQRRRAQDSHTNLISVTAFNSFMLLVFAFDNALDNGRELPPVSTGYAGALFVCIPRCRDRENLYVLRESRGAEREWWSLLLKIAFKNSGLRSCFLGNIYEITVPVLHFVEMLCTHHSRAYGTCLVMK